MRTIVLAFVFALSLGSSGCTMFTFNNLGHRFAPIEVEAVERARIERTPTLVLTVRERDGAERVERVPLPSRGPGRFWPAGELPVRPQVVALTRVAPQDELEVAYSSARTALGADRRWIELHSMAPVLEGSIERAWIEVASAVVVTYRTDADADDEARTASVPLAPDREWPAGELPIGTDHLDAPLVVVTRARGIDLRVDGRAARLVDLRGDRSVDSPVPWLLLPFTVAIDLATLPLSLPLTLIGLNFHT